MKKVIIIILTILIPAKVFTQDKLFESFKIEIGKPYGVIEPNTNDYFSIDSNIFVVRNIRDGYIIQKFDENTLRLETRRTITRKNNKSLPEAYVPEYVKKINNRILVFYSLWESDIEHLLYQEIDLAKGNFKDKAKLLVSVNDRISGWRAGETKRYGVMVEDKFKFFASNNDSTFLITYKRLPEIKNTAKNFDILGFNVFDINLSKVWSKEVRMPYTEKRMDIIDYYVDNKGNVFLLSMIFKNKVSEKALINGKPNYRIEVLKITPKSDKVEIIEIPLENKIINSIALYTDFNDDLILGGFYINSGNNIEDAKGFFYIKMDKNGVVKDNSIFDFPIELINQNESNKTKKKNNKKSEEEVTLPSLLLEKIVVDLDGSLIIIGEQREVRLTGPTSVIDDYNSIIVAKVNPEGEFHWIRKLPKKQNPARYNAGFSFKHFSYGENFYFLFMDDPENVNSNIDEEPKTYTGEPGGYLTQYELNTNTGEVSKSYLINSLKVSGMPIYYFNPWSMVNVSDGVYVFEAYKNNKQEILIKATHNY